MKIFAFVDLHGSFSTLEKIKQVIKEKNPDLIICAGDISNFGNDLVKLVKEFSDLKKPFLIIPGNHETEEEIYEICKEFKDFAIDIHKGSYEIDNYIIFGYGGEGFTEESKEFEKIAERFLKHYDRNKTLIFVTHAPPYGTRLDYLSGLGHRGNKSFRKFIEQAKPKLVICGHFHENANVIDKMNSTVIINPGKQGKLIEV